MIGCAFALQHEAAAFIGLLKNRESFRLGEVPCYRGTLHGKPVFVAIIGMGAETAARRTAKLLQEVDLELLILPGYAGALSPHLRRPSLHLPINYLSAEAAWADRLAHLPQTRLYSAAEVVGSADGRRVLVEQGWEIVDMETAAVAALCAEQHVPLLPLRVISDEAQEELPSGALAASFDLQTQRPTPLKLIAHLIRHPGEAPGFFHLIWSLGKARQALTSALEELLA